jgi:hypothetical protein
MSRKLINNITKDTLVQRGNRLKLWWESKGWSKVEFAGRMKIWPQNVSKYFAGKLDPISLIEQLIKEGCDIGWIVNGESTGQINKGIVAETSANSYNKRDVDFHGMSDQTKRRIDKLIKLLESGPDKTDKEMLDILIKTMEKRQKGKKKS